MPFRLFSPPAPGSCGQTPPRGTCPDSQKSQTSRPTGRPPALRPAAPRGGPKWGRGGRESGGPSSWRKAACWCGPRARHPGALRSRKESGKGNPARSAPCPFPWAFPEHRPAPPSLRKRYRQTFSCRPGQRFLRRHPLSAPEQELPRERPGVKNFPCGRPARRPCPQQRRPNLPATPGNVSKPSFS